jgi:hypothetical protein
VKSPECYRLAIWLVPVVGMSNVTLTVGPSTNSRCEEASAWCLDMRAAKLVSTGQTTSETCSSYLRPNPKF